MNKVFQIILGISVLLISSVVAVLGWQALRDKKEQDIDKTMAKVRKAKAKKRDNNLNEIENEKSAIIEHNTPDN